MKVVLGVDTGTDDAVTVMLAPLSPELDVIGVCSANSNRGIGFTTESTLRVVEYLGAAQAPVHGGCILPMISILGPGRRINISYTGPEDPEDNVHDDYVDLSPVTIKPAPGNAVSWLIGALMESRGGVVLVPVEPLTNIAMVLRTEPAIAKKIKQVVLMGGGCRETNITPSAEFNLWINPEAAKVVFNDGCDITVVPLDTTHAAAISIEDAKELRGMEMKASVMTTSIIEHRWNGYKNWQPMDDINTVPVHDTLVVYTVLSPQVLSPVVPVHADIDIGGDVSDGQNISDLDRRVKRTAPNVEIALGVDRALFSKMLKEILEGSGS